MEEGRWEGHCSSPAWLCHIPAVACLSRSMGPARWPFLGPGPHTGDTFPSLPSRPRMATAPALKSSDAPAALPVFFTPANAFRYQISLVPPPHE